MGTTFTRASPWRLGEPYTIRDADGQQVGTRDLLGHAMAITQLRVTPGTRNQLGPNRYTVALGDREVTVTRRFTHDEGRVIAVFGTEPGDVCDIWLVVIEEDGSGFVTSNLYASAPDTPAHALLDVLV